jgi:small subunit ribosomal protein S13
LFARQAKLYTESLSLNRPETTVRPSHESPRQREEDLRKLQSGAAEGPGVRRLHERSPQTAAGVVGPACRAGTDQAVSPVAKVRLGKLDLLEVGSQRHMPRLLGVDIPNDKPIVISLRYLYGVGDQIARELCHKAGIETSKHARDLHEEEVARLTTILEKDYTVEGQLRRQVGQDISRLRDIKCYRGMRHRLGLPVRGQRTRTNARTRKGPKKTVAGKKGVKDLR